MKKILKSSAATLIVGATLLTALPAQAFWGWGPFDWFDDDDDWYGPWGYGPYGHPGYWGGYPGYGYGYPGYGYGHPGYGYGYPGYGYGHPGSGYPYAYPYTAPTAPAAPAGSSPGQTK
jgi:hypothetical protein